MKLDRAWTLVAIGMALLLFGLGDATLAQQDDNYTLRRWSVDSGGVAFSNADAYTLGGTAGQFDAGTLAVGDYILYGGFWSGGITQYRIYLPLVIRD